VVKVTAVDEVTDDLVSAVHRLLPQLSTSAPLPSGADLGRVVGSPVTTLFVARVGPATDDVERAEALSADGRGPAAQGEDGEIVGMLTLAIFYLPTGTRAWVEDVVVDASGRGQGVGAALVGAAVQLAGARGALTVDLTSRPSREDANRLYVRLGFEPRTTNVYRLVLGR